MFINQNADSYDRETEQYIVAYIDILGVTNRIKDKDKNELQMNDSSAKYFLLPD